MRVSARESDVNPAGLCAFTGPAPERTQENLEEMPPRPRFPNAALSSMGLQGCSEREGFHGQRWMGSQPAICILQLKRTKRAAIKNTPVSFLFEPRRLTVSLTKESYLFIAAITVLQKER